MTSDKKEPLGLRYNTGKPVLSLMMEAREALEGGARVLEFGANKYARGNWHKGMEHTQLADCLLRHLVAYLNGEESDPESGQLHVDHVLVNALMLSQMVHTRPDLDNRSPELLK